MNKRRLLLAIPGLLFTYATYAQENVDTLKVIAPESQIQAGFFDSNALDGIDYSEFQLPPLGVLFENAKTTPSIEILEKERQLAEKLLSKEKRAFLGFFYAHGNYSYGNTSSTTTSSDISTPNYVISNGVKSDYWNIGGSVNIGLETLFDLKGRVNRQRIQVEKVTLEKEIIYDELKQKIATIYVRITNNLIALKTAAENAAAYRGAGLMMEQKFRINQATMEDLAGVKRYEYDAIQSYQGIQSQISTDIILLEIMTHTPIITNTITSIQLTNSKK